MDISMPVMDGFEAIREIRRLESEAPPPTGKRARIAALTGLSSELSRKEALSSGGDAFLTKPIKLDTVRRLLEELVGDR
jgi:CheY-like chemotaxis protein